MSKLSELITAEQTGHRVPGTMPLTHVKCSAHDIASYHSAEYGIEYRISVRLGANVIVADPSTLDKAVSQVRRGIIHEVYGEFLSSITDARIALYEHDLERAHNVLNDMYNRMVS